MAIYAIGDIHGCLGALKAIFNQGLINKKDLVIFLGDYVDRGPNSKGVIDWLIKHSRDFNFEFIQGNHEIMMLAARDNPNNLIDWLYFGGAATLDSYKIGYDSNLKAEIDIKHWEFIENGLPYIQLDKYIFVHAGLEIGIDLDKQNEHHLFWKKYETPEAYSQLNKVICGHTSRKNGEIADFGHTICIDTYAYGGMWLTCLNVETNEYIKANNNGTVEKGPSSGSG